MGFYDAIRIGASGAVDSAFTVDRSLRFNSAGSAYLTRTPSSTGNQKVWTWSGWIKRTKIGGVQYLFASNEYNSSGDGIAAIYFNSDKINTYYDSSGSNTYGNVNNRVYRDLGAWYHIVWQVDAANTTHKIWINGVEETGLSHHPINFNYTMNQAGHTNVIGTSPWNTSGSPSDIYLAEVHFSDGNKYQASDFAETDATTGQWVPKASPAITYGTNGFYLNFSDNSGTTATTLGKDSSGNGNNFTPNNFEISTGVGNDSVTDTPTNNFPTLNPLYNPVNTTFGEGNLLMRGGDNFAASTFLLPKSGKWYAEFSKYNNGQLQSISVTRANTAMTNYAGYLGLADNVEYVSNGELGNRTRGSTSDATAWTNDAGVVVAVAVDMDNGAVYFARNNTWQNSGDPTSGSSKTGAIATDLLTDNDGDHVIAVHGYNGSNSYGLYANFGQQPLTYTPPTGYKVLSSANLPDPTILLPEKHFVPVLWTGNSASGGSGTTQTISGLNFAPDWLWIKSRSGSQVHSLNDTVRGVNKQLNSASNDSETSYSGRIGTFNSDGFILGADGDVNYNGYNYVGWNWNAGDTDGKTYTVTVVSDSGNKYRFDGFGTSAVTLDLAEGGTYIFNYPSAHPLKFSTTSDGTHGGGSEYTTGVTHNSSTQVTIVVAASAPQLFYYCSIHSGMGGAVNTNSTKGSSNFDGSLQAVVKANPTAGFSVITYTGTNNVSETLGHGLGVKPDTIIVKARNVAGQDWVLYNKNLDGGNQPATHIIKLNTTGAEADVNDVWQDTEPTSTVFTIGTEAMVNHQAGHLYVAYVFSEVAGYSKFGSYVGNGNSDGTFVFTGFRPAWVMIKCSSSTFNWMIYDSKREPFNLIDKYLMANSNNAEAGSSTDNPIDFLSNGFKLRYTNTSTNQNGGTFIYLAFAESPFKNARAR